MRVKTISGVSVDINTAELNDMEFLDALALMQRGDPIGMSTVADKLLGEQKRAVYDSIRVEGRVPVDVFTAELIGIFKTIKEADEDAKKV